jgi:predicted RNA-binding Zn ribbon-like protein
MAKGKGFFDRAGFPPIDVTEWSCLDLANSVEPHVDRSTALADYVDVVRWARHEGLLDAREGRRQLERAGTRPRQATAAYRRMLRLQDVLRGVFSAVGRGARPPKAHLDKLNTEVGRAMVRVRLVLTPAGFRREWLDPRDDLAWVLGPVARSASDLLVSTASSRLRECPGSPGRPCGFLFIDETRNRSRRWCSGATCGNRSRLHRYYARLGGGGSSEIDRAR